jgi:predicted XRE-type DNA-binding protein
MKMFSQDILDKANDCRITESSGNIFADLGLPNPEERLLKSDLAIHIARLIRDKGLTQQDAARLAGVSQPQLSNIIRGRLSGYSVEKLLRIINCLGRRVEVRISARDVKPERAVTAVSVAR